MDITTLSGYFRPNTSSSGILSILILAGAISGSELLLFFGYFGYAIWAYAMLLFALTLVPLLFRLEMVVIQAFALIAVFRLVNLTMPNLIDFTLIWFLIIYGPFILAFFYLGFRSFLRRQESSETNLLEDQESGGIGDMFPWWLGGTRGGRLRKYLRKVRQVLAGGDNQKNKILSRLRWALGIIGLILVPSGILLLGVLLVPFYLANIEFGIIRPLALVPSLDVYNILILTLTMVVFVGFVEEMIFRGAMQNVLESQLGTIPGLILSSFIYGLMHSAHGIPLEILFAGGVGLLFGIVYDITDSIVLVAVAHGLLNTYLFGVIPLGGPSPIDLWYVLSL